MEHSFDADEWTLFVFSSPLETLYSLRHVALFAPTHCDVDPKIHQEVRYSKRDEAK